ncbi:branched-chain amino acid ABC transporter permease [Arenibaculum pallidiluteum]|uniref:branched-chain amino acid ABC transporter permease n=1 Tax=Arenibaculum pallidiluteum TaxID=2812559 RepID=UPI001F1C8771|nr:branched-chain amino acid ABC transporter permease [Arenibaculum pallidiluteum]
MADPQVPSGTAHRLGPAAVACALLLVGCGIDDGQARICRSLIAAFEDDPAALSWRPAEPHPTAPHGVRLPYAAPGPAGGEHWIACSFRGGAFSEGRLALEGVATDRTGALNPAQMRFMEIALAPPRAPLALPGPSADQAARPAAAGRSALYLAQQLLNATGLCCVYGLLAMGYSLVYGVLRRVDLAFGGLLMTGAYAAVILVVLLGMAGLGGQPLLLAPVLALVMGLVGLQGWAVERLVHRPLVGTRGQAPLVASLGLAIALSEGVRLLQGTRDRWLAQPFSGTLVLVDAPGFPLTVTLGQIAVLALTAALAGGVLSLLRRTGLGRALRACADDMGAAALVGVDTRRAVAAAFALGGALAAAAGLVVALHYGGVNFFMGWAIGFKALAAAVVGGIGSVPGALLGGVLIGLLETLWTGYFDTGQKDIAIFVLLTAFLILRPDGLLGQARDRGD